MEAESRAFLKPQVLTEDAAPVYHGVLLNGVGSQDNYLHLSVQIVQSPGVMSHEQDRNPCPHGVPFPASQGQ